MADGPRTVDDILASDFYAPGITPEEFERDVRILLADSFLPEDVEPWLHDPNSAFGGRTPLETITAGDGKHVLILLISVMLGVIS